MRIILIHPNYHSGGAEIAGNWPPAWVAYICGPLKAAGYTDIRFVDAMTNNLSEDDSAPLSRKKSPISSVRQRSRRQSTRPSVCCRSRKKLTPAR